MPTCPTIKDYDDYPDYVKKLIKEAELSKDKELQECLCRLRKPLDGNNCIIQDEDKKIVIFPFCLNDEEPIFEPNSGNIANLALTYKQAMELFWKPVKDKTLKFDIKAKGKCTCEQGSGSVTGNNNIKSDKRDLKSVICGLGIGAVIDTEDERATKHIDSGPCSYGNSDYYMGLGIGLFIYYDGFQAWIDTEAKKIYPYIGAGANLGACESGCYPDVIATSSSISGKQITINLGSDDCQYEVKGTSDGTIKIDLI